MIDQTIIDKLKDQIEKPQYKIRRKLPTRLPLVIAFFIILISFIITKQKLVAEMFLLLCVIAFIISSFMRKQIVQWETRGKQKISFDLLNKGEYESTDSHYDIILNSFSIHFTNTLSGKIKHINEESNNIIVALQLKEGYYMKSQKHKIFHWLFLVIESINHENITIDNWIQKMRITVRAFFFGYGCGDLKDVIKEDFIVLNIWKEVGAFVRLQEPQYRKRLLK